MPLHDYNWQKQFNDGRITLLHTGMGVTVMVPSARRPALLAKFSDVSIDGASHAVLITALPPKANNDNGASS